MHKEQFLEELQEILQREKPLTLDMPLSTIEEWDSLAKMSTSAFLNLHFGKQVGIDAFRAMHTVADIARAAGFSL